MKKFFALAIVALLFATAAYAQTYNTDQGNTEFEIYVVCPIMVNPDNGPAVDLGDIIPGQTKTYATPVYANFQVKGEPGFQFTTAGTVQTIGTFGGPGSPAGSVTITSFQWEESQVGAVYNTTSSTGPWTLNNATGSTCATDNYFFRCGVTAVNAAANAVSGNYTFDVTLTATYVNL